MAAYIIQLENPDKYTDINNDPKVMHQYLIKVYASSRLCKHDYGGNGGTVVASGILYAHGIGVEKNYHKAAH